MARIFDNIEQDLLGTLRATMQVSTRSYFPRGRQRTKVAAHNDYLDVEEGLVK
jgi:hypothetical protein